MEMVTGHKLPRQKPCPKLLTSIRIHNSLVHLENVYRALSSNNLVLLQLIKAFGLILSIQGGAKLIEGEFNAPRIYCFNRTASSQSFKFLPEIHVEGWTQHDANPTRRKISLTQYSPMVYLMLKDNFPCNDHQMVTDAENLQVREHLLQSSKLNWFDCRSPGALTGLIFPLRLAPKKLPIHYVQICTRLITPEKAQSPQV